MVRVNLSMYRVLFLGVGLDFFAFVLLIIYLGAIMVLFIYLFIIMTLYLK